MAFPQAKMVAVDKCDSSAIALPKAIEYSEPRGNVNQVERTISRLFVRKKLAGVIPSPPVELS
jgi:hypothetical protein